MLQAAVVDAEPTRAPTKPALGVFVVALLGFSLTATYSGPTIMDVWSGALQAWGLGTTGRPWLEVVGDPAAVTYAMENLKGFGWVNGHIVYANAIGSWMFTAPFYAILGDPSQFGLLGTAVAAVVFSALGVLWMYLALYRIVPHGYALIGAGIYAFGLPTWSVSADGTWGHTITQCAIAGAALAAAKNKWWLAGLALGVGSFARAHLLLIPAVLGTGMAWSRRSVVPVLQVGLTSAASLAVLVGLNTIVYGEPSIGGGRTDPLSRVELGDDVRGISYFKNLAGFLISPGRGILVFTPLLVVLLPAVIKHWRTMPDWTRWLAAGGITYTAAQLWVAHFFGGDAYNGYRLGLELVTCLVPLYTLAAARSGPRTQTIAAFFATLQVGVTAIGAWLRPWIAAGTEWTNNELIVLWRQGPVAVSVLLLAIVALAVVLARQVLRRSREPSASVRS